MPVRSMLQYPGVPLYGAMNVLISVMLDIEGYPVRRRGSFRVRDADFKKDPDWSAAIQAYEWIQEQKQEHGRRIEIIQVTYNEKNDITKLVKQLRPNFPDNLPF